MPVNVANTPPTAKTFVFETVQPRPVVPITELEGWARDLLLVSDLMDLPIISRWRGRGGEEILVFGLSPRERKTVAKGMTPTTARKYRAGYRFAVFSPPTTTYPATISWLYETGGELLILMFEDMAQKLQEHMVRESLLE